MYLMRIGPTGSERPVVRIDDTHYVDVSDVVSDFDEAFFGGDGISSLSGVVSERVSAGRLTAFSGERVGPPHCQTPPNLVYRPELQRPRRRDGGAGPRRTDPVHQVAEHTHRP
jgi:hypothetical protein